MWHAGQPWTEAEHLQFLTGLKKLGRGNWRGISRLFVPTRTPTQVRRFLPLQLTPNVFYRPDSCDAPHRLACTVRKYALARAYLAFSVSAGLQVPPLVRARLSSVLPIVALQPLTLIYTLHIPTSASRYPFTRCLGVKDQTPSIPPLYF